MISHLAQELMGESGSLARAISEIDKLADAVWNVLIFAMEGVAKSGYELGRMRPFRFDYFREQILDALNPAVQDSQRRELLVSLLLRSRLVRIDASGTRVRCLVDAANPLVLTSEFFGDSYRADDLKYFVVSNLRRKHQMAFSHTTGFFFRTLADTVNRALAGEPLMESSRSGIRIRARRGISINVFKDLLNSARFAGDVESSDLRPLSIDAFIDSCRLVNYLRPHFAFGEVAIITNQVDSEYLVSNVFGMPSGIQGFDDLFGGGGILLGDSYATPERDQIRGRVVLTVGRYGTGKTLLALQMAVSIARKGGIVWLVHFEQTRQEYLYTLRSMTYMPSDGSVEVVTDSATAAEVLRGPIEGKGVVILLASQADSYRGFLDRFEKRIDELAAWPLRAIVVDSLNAIRHDNPSGTSSARSEAVELFNKAKRSGANVWLIAEEGVERHLEFWKNIADTVVRLSVDLSNDALIRYIEVLKSRLQREQTGRHVVLIAPGEGIRVVPSTTAVRARLSARSLPSQTQSVEFGHIGIDRALGAHGLVSGDLIVIHGPSGTHKSQLAIQFLAHSDRLGSLEAESLLVTPRESENATRASIRKILDSTRPRKLKSADRIRVLALPHGYVVPGLVLQLVEEQLTLAQRHGVRIDRAVVDDLRFWELSSPLIREDRTFADALIDLFKRYNVTTLMNCSEFVEEVESSLQRTVLDYADVILETHRVELQGISRVLGRFVKSRSMEHGRESFEVKVVSGALAVEPSFSLVRFRPNGESVPISVQLFLHQENEAQGAYNRRICQQLSSMLSVPITLKNVDEIQIQGAADFIGWSVRDELRIFQLDEFQVPNALERRSGQTFLRRFPKTQLTGWDQIAECLVVRCADESAFWAVPYFVNLGFLAYRDSVVKDKIESWSALSRLCSEWEEKHEGGLFFDFTKGTKENANCLFLEILSSLGSPDCPGRSGCSLLDWLDSDKAREALDIFWVLCHRSYKRALSRQDFNRCDPEAAVWRHWYTTLIPFLSDLSSDTRDDLRCTFVPGPGVSGEWYLGVAGDSAATDVASEILAYMTKGAQELERLRTGVGIPVRSWYYQSGDERKILWELSDKVEVQGHSLIPRVRDCLRRSQFGCYERISGVLSDHLLGVLKLPAKQGKPSKQIVEVWSSLLASVKLVESEVMCQRCKWPNPMRQIIPAANLK